MAPIPQRVAAELVRARHYLHAPASAVRLSLGVFGGGELLGCAIFNPGPRNGHRLLRGATQADVLHLARFWLDDRAPRNSDWPSTASVSPARPSSGRRWMARWSRLWAAWSVTTPTGAEPRWPWSAPSGRPADVAGQYTAPCSGSNLEVGPLAIPSVPTQIPCPLCQEPLAMFVTTSKRGRHAIGLVCKRSGKHLRGFINDDAFVATTIGKIAEAAGVSVEQVVPPMPAPEPVEALQQPSGAGAGARSPKKRGRPA